MSTVDFSESNRKHLLREISPSQSEDELLLGTLHFSVTEIRIHSGLPTGEVKM